MMIMRDIIVPKLLTGSLVLFIFKGFVLFYFSEPIHVTFVFLLFSLRPNTLPRLFSIVILSVNDVVSLHINIRVVTSENSLIDFLRIWKLTSLNSRILTYFCAGSSADRISNRRLRGQPWPTQ